jgi:hypothetical protein
VGEDVEEEEGGDRGAVRGVEVAAAFFFVADLDFVDVGLAGAFVMTGVDAGAAFGVVADDGFGPFPALDEDEDEEGLALAECGA